MSGSDDPNGDETPGERQPQGGQGGQHGGAGNRSQRQPQGGQPQAQTQGQYQQGQQQGYQQGGQYQYQAGGSALGSDFTKYAKLSLGTHLTFGLGLALTVFLFFTLAPQGTTQSFPFGGAGQGSATLFVSTLFAFVLAVFLSALPSLGVGFYVGQTADEGTSPPLVSAAVNVIGVVGTALLLFVLAVVFAPTGGGSGAGQLIGPVIGTAIAVAAVGAAAGSIGDRVDSW
jgi:hypothetical protein